MPENLSANQGSGSSIVFNILAKYVFSVQYDTVLRRHLGSDFLVVSWIFELFSIWFFIYCIYLSFTSPFNLELGLTFAAGITLFVACSLFLYSSYPENIGSSDVYDLVFCDKTPRVKLDEMLLRFAVKNNYESCSEHDIEVTTNTKYKNHELCDESGNLEEVKEEIKSQQEIIN
jgi:hypothetical protein